MLKPFKQAGTDKIVPALPQQGTEHLAANLCHIFRARLAGRNIPEAWRWVKLMFITQLTMVNYVEAKAHCHINLSHFMLRLRHIVILIYHTLC
jgi:hypothetical protein